MTKKRLTQLATEHKDLIERTRTLLATNFDIPARDIIAAACSQMGIKSKDWSELNAIELETFYPPLQLDDRALSTNDNEDERRKS